MPAREEGDEYFKYGVALAYYDLADGPLEPGEGAAQLARLRYFVFNQINFPSRAKIYAIIGYKGRPVKSVGVVGVEISAFCARSRLSLGEVSRDCEAVTV